MTSDIKELLGLDPRAIDFRKKQSSKSIKGLFSFNHKAKSLSGAELSSSGPILIASSDDVKTITVEDYIIIDEKEYRVIAKFTDPFGRCELNLSSDQGLEGELSIENSSVFYRGDRND